MDKINTEKPDRPSHKKGGAPCKKIKRNNGIRVRLTTSERFLIETRATQAGMRISDWIRASALNAKITARITLEERRILHMLAGMANNLNQLARLAHTGGILGIAIRCDFLLKEIDTALKYINNDDGKSG